MLKVNPNTVQRAYRDMETMGLIETIRNKPSTITEDEEILKKHKKRACRGCIRWIYRKYESYKIN